MVSKIFNDVLEKVISYSADWIHFPQTADEIVEAREIWSNLFKMSNIIGEVDCTLVEIR